MSTFFMHVGQCGIQVGEEFWKLAEIHCQSNINEGQPLEEPNIMFSGQGNPRCILVDAEPKVANKFQQSISSINSGNVIRDQSGRGNNWAMGFSYRYNSEFFEQVQDSVRRETERLDYFTTVVIMHSLAGGTGAGVGSALLQWLRQEFPKAWLTPVCLGPRLNGDTPLQNYNSCFTLQFLLEYADAIFYRNNADLMHLASRKSAFEDRQKQRQKGIKPTFSANGPVSVGKMNEILAADLAAYIFPTQRKGLYHGWNAGDTIPKVGIISDLKFLDVRSTFSMPPLKEKGGIILWQDIMKRYSKTFYGFPSEAKCFGAHIKMHGFNQSSDSKMKVSDIVSILPKSLKPYGWSYNEVEPSVEFSQTSQGTGICACSNQSICVQDFSHLLSRAEKMFEVSAYFHWYENFGLEEKDFTAAFDRIYSYLEAMESR